jgi:hypothetical protein
VTALPRAVAHLLETEINSFEKLELLRRARGGTTPITRDDAGFDNESMRTAIAELVKARLLADHGGVLSIGARGREPSMNELMALYDDDRLAVVSALSAFAMDRLRTLASTAFSNAFVLRKKRRDPDG